MTRKQFKRQKLFPILNSAELESGLSKPDWADPDKIEEQAKSWKADFLSQFSWSKLRKTGI